MYVCVCARVCGLPQSHHMINPKPDVRRQPQELMLREDNSQLVIAGPIPNKKNK